MCSSDLFQTLNIPCWRPLLTVNRQAIMLYAQQQGLRWIEDDSNTNTLFNRNYLRHQIIPLLQQRWPSVNQQLAIGFGIAFGLIVLKLFENTDLINGEIHNAFRLTFLTVGILTILSGFVFRRLHISDGKNMKSKEE